MTTLVSLVFALALLCGVTPALAQNPAPARNCESSTKDLPGLSLLAVRVGRLAPGEAACFALSLRQGEFTRIAVVAEVGYLRARILDPQGKQLQVTWTSAFSTASPSLPLVIEAPASGAYRLELSVPTWVQFTNAQSFRVQMVDWQSEPVRAAHRQALRRDPRVAWLRNNARRLRSIDPGDSDYSDLQFLTEVLRDKRVVFLGEGENGGGSDVLAKTRLVKFLHERMGFDVIAFQAGIHSSTAAWRALQADTNPREAVLKSVFGLLARSAQAEELINYLDARARTQRPLELVGFDSQFTGTAGTTLVPELRAFLAERGVKSALSDSQAVAARVLAGTIAGQFRSGGVVPSLSDQAQTVEALRATALEIERVVPDRHGARWAQVLRSTAVQIGLALNNARGVASSEYMSGLVRQMADNLIWLVNKAYRDQKVIVWTHTSHAIRNPEATSRGRIAGHTVGQGLWKVLGSESFAIGLTSYNGRSHWITGADDYYQDLVPGQHPAIDFESLMVEAGYDIGFVDLRAARSRADWLGGRFVASPLYVVPAEAEWSSALDALLFIRTQEPRTRGR